jgi:hypothetical protein
MRLRDVLRRQGARPGLFLRNDNADGKSPRNAVDLQAAQRYPPLGVGDRHVGSQPARERSTRPLLGEVKAHRRSRNRLAGLIRHGNCQWTRAPATWRMHRAFAFDHLDLENRDLGRRGANKRYSERGQPENPGMHLHLDAVMRPSAPGRRSRCPDRPLFSPPPPAAGSFPRARRRYALPAGSFPSRR